MCARCSLLPFLALGLAWVSTHPLSAQLITARVTIQPIHVADDSGNNLSNPTYQYNTAALNAIWAQAGIDVVFLPAVQFNSTLFLTPRTSPGQAGNAAYYINLIAFPGHGQYEADNHVLNLWFVDSFFGSPSQTGFGAIGQNGMMVSDNATTRLDTIAHELGHNLGLNHTTGGTNLMHASANAPTCLCHIAPVGTLSGLSQSQRTDAQLSYFAVDLPVGQQYTYTPVPEPATTAAVTALGLLGFAYCRKRFAQKD